MTMNAPGLVSIRSRNSVKVTVDRLEASLKAKGITVFARIDHAAGAAAVGTPLRPTELLIFGNPTAGTPLMQAEQTIGIDLPLKALAWEDASGDVWIAYNDPAWLAVRHGLRHDTADAVHAMAGVAVHAMAGTLAKFAEVAAGG
jgi:uncharacterized protein (DUF302 family)